MIMANETESKAACADPRCPMHGSLKTKGTVLEGRVVSTKAKKTAVVEIPYVKKEGKYERFEKRRSKIHAHVPDCIQIAKGDWVRLEECRRLSRTKAFVVTKKAGGVK
ncbi:MAG: 30S ribosomal protein S17 [Candidatus Micrarchaeota archaeon]|nr:30S ribosomal protein S17 [Candidatus Micrarchaeota archaeon]